MDFSIENGLSPIYVFFDLILLLIIINLFFPAIKRPGRLGRSKIRIGIFLMICFCEFSFWGTDWFHYKNILERIYAHPYARTNLEPIYVLINSCVFGSYFLFRLVVWGTALYLFNSCIRLLNLKEDLCYYIFSVLGLLLFSYGRFSLAMSVQFFAILLLYKADDIKRASLCKIFSILLLIASVFLHKSAFLIIVLFLLFSICNRLPVLKSRYLYIIIICMMPICAYILRDYIKAFLIYDSVSNSETMQQAISSGQHYMENDSHLGLGAILGVVLQSAPFYISGYISYKFISIRRGIANMKYASIFKYSKLYIFLLLAISFFLLDLGVDTYIFYDRFIKYLIIPEVLLLCFFFREEFYGHMVNESYKYRFD